jgi:hypothetical protein
VFESGQLTEFSAVAEVSDRVWEDFESAASASSAIPALPNQLTQTSLGQNLSSAVSANTDRSELCIRPHEKPRLLQYRTAAPVYIPLSFID